MHLTHSRWRKPKARLSEKQKEQRRKAAAQSKESEAGGPSTSAKKIGYFEDDFVPEAVREEDFIIVHSEFLDELVKKVNCDDCGERKLVVPSDSVQGFARSFRLQCEACGREYGDIIHSSPRVGNDPDKKQTLRPFLINKRMVEAFTYMGGGYASMATFGREVGMSVLSSSAFHKQLKNIEKDNLGLKKKMLEETHKVIRELHGVGPDVVLDMAVSFDGTWQKRGHTSLNGAAFVIDIETGLILDFIVLSKYCQSCVQKSSSSDTESLEYIDWLKKHENSGDCQINYKGSSGAMEKTAAEHLWLRSLDDWKMRYLDILSDGDASTYEHLRSLDVYKGTPIKKEECINHISKRLGTALRDVVTNERLKGVTLGGRAEGALKETSIVKLQSYYRNAVMANIPNIKAMQSAIMATLDHCSSTDREPKHNKCPEGSDSWCKFNKAKALNQKCPPHSTMSLKLSSLVVSKIEKVYVRLSQEALLERCIRAGTQNSNESLHAQLWRKCSKEVFVSRSRIEVAAVQAATEFNMGYAKGMMIRREAEGLTSTAVARAEKQDERRKRQSGQQEQTTKERALKKIKKAADAKKVKKSADYKAGGH